MSEENENGGLSVTLKGGSGYEAPWIVIRGKDADELHKNLYEMFGVHRLEDPMLAVATLSKAFQNAYKSAVTAVQTGVSSSSTGQQSATAVAPEQNPQQLLSQHLGATVIETSSVDTSPATSGPSAQSASQTTGASVPHEVRVCPLHGPRKYFGPGVSERTGKEFGASYRCIERGCAAKPPKPLSLWQRWDGVWQEKDWSKK